MALYIVDNNGHGIREKLWHIGKPTPIIEDEVVEVQADGDELEYIINNFPNLPYPKHRRVVRWKGDLAKLITHHL